MKILFSCKFELKGSICLFPIFYPMSIPSTHYPDRARPTANTPAQSSYYYNLLALYYVLLLNIIISINVFMYNIYNFILPYQLTTRILRKCPNAEDPVRDN